MSEEKRKVSPRELQEHDGQEERPAFVAYQGRVYDVSQSKLWRGGVHVRRHNAGQDLTESFAAAPHDESVFERVALVGQLAAEEAEAPEREAPAWLDWFLGQHPHPTAVHFPVAFIAGSGVMLLLYLLTGNLSFEKTAYYLLWMGVVMAPLTILTGALSWWYNYLAVLSRPFRGKINLSILLLILGGIALGLRTARPDALVDRDAVGWIYFGLVAASLLAVAGLGWIGGRIVWGRRS